MTLARRTDPLTSHLAGTGVDLTKGQRVVLEAFRHIGPQLTDEQLVGLVRGQLSPSGARTRRAELVERGMIVDSGRIVRGRTGRAMIVWALPSESEQQGMWGK